MGFLSEGKKKENNFLEDYKMVHNNVTSKFSTEDEDINKHFDLIINDKKYDIKGVKKITRTDFMANENYHWVELKNVHGKLGWLYGEADYFAFELNEYWVIVDKTKLQKFIANKVNKNVIATEQDEALYCIYKRNDRKDFITLIKTIDLMFIANEIIPKSNSTSLIHQFGDSIHPEKCEKQRLAKLTLKKL